MNVEALTIALDLAELPKRGIGSSWDDDGYDRRFRSLRGAHEFLECADKWMTTFKCRHCLAEEFEAMPFCLRSDLGSLIRAVAACDLLVSELTDCNGVWSCILLGNFTDINVSASGDSPELATAKALSQAVLG